MTKSFDVFLSHNSKDKPAVRELAEALRARGLKVWLDECELVPGRPWQEALEEVIETTRASAVLVGKDGLGPWQDREMRGCLNEFVRRELPVIPVLLPGAPEVPKLPIFLNEFTWVDLRGGLTEGGIDRLQWGITGERPPDRSKPPLSSILTPSQEAAVAAYSTPELRPRELGKPPFEPGGSFESSTEAFSADAGREGIARQPPADGPPFRWADLQSLYFESFDAADMNVDPPEVIHEKIIHAWWPEQDDVWTSTLEGGLYRLINKVAPKAVRYRCIQVNEEDMSELPVSVEVRTQSDEAALFGAGLVYRFDEESRDYYTFTVTGGDQVAFYLRQSGGYLPLYSGRTRAIAPDRFNKLGIISEGDTFHLFANDVLIKSVRSAALPRGRLGIIAMGKGTFSYDNFVVYKAPRPQ